MLTAAIPDGADLSTGQLRQDIIQEVAGSVKLAIVFHVRGPGLLKLRMLTLIP